MSRARRVEIWLASPHLRRLRGIAELDGVSLSRALAEVIKTHGVGSAMMVGGPAKLTSQVSMTMDDTTLALLDAMAAHWGGGRSEAARRLIERAIEQPSMRFKAA